MDREWMGEFINLFFSGNREDFAKGIVLKNNFIPQRLFQYKSLEPDEESGMIYAIDAIKNKTVHLSDPKSFNDPFDSAATKIQKSIGNEPNNMVENQTMNFARDLVKISCFSHAPNDKPMNMPMWYHYANKYRGICIEYDMNIFTNTDTRRIYMFPVEYAESIIDVTDYFSSDNPLKKSSFGIRVAVRKHNDWNYENEWRYITPNEKEVELPFPAISAVYMGHKICESNEKILCKIAQEQNISLYKMKLGNRGICFSEINATDIVTQECLPFESPLVTQNVMPKNQTNCSNIGGNNE
jgi:hypothetical protein